MLRSHKSTGGFEWNITSRNSRTVGFLYRYRQAYQRFDFQKLAIDDPDEQHKHIANFVMIKLIEEAISQQRSEKRCAKTIKH